MDQDSDDKRLPGSVSNQNQEEAEPEHGDGGERRRPTGGSESTGGGSSGESGGESGEGSQSTGHPDSAG